VPARVAHRLDLGVFARDLAIDTLSQPARFVDGDSDGCGTPSG